MTLNFKEKFEEVRSGKIFLQFGLNGNPFSPSPLDIKKSFINRDNETEKFIRAIHDLNQNRTPHIPILGSHGIGKSHFLKYLFEIVNENKDQLGLKEIYFIKGENDFKEKFCKEYNDFEDKNCLLFIDDLDIITIHNTQRVNLFFGEFNGKIIGTWNYKAWTNVNRKVDFKIPKAEPIALHSFSKEHSLDIIRTRLKLSTEDEETVNSFFPPDILDICVMMSMGNPNKILAIARQYLDYLFYNDIENVTQTVIRDFAKTLNLQSIEESLKKLDDLTKKQRDILRKIIDMEEVSANKLAEAFQFSRVAAVQYLKDLQKRGLLESREKERVVYYYVPTEIVDEIDEKLENFNEDK